MKHRQPSMKNATLGKFLLSARQGHFHTLTVLILTLSGFLLGGGGIGRRSNGSCWMSSIKRLQPIIYDCPIYRRRWQTVNAGNGQSGPTCRVQIPARPSFFEAR